MAVQPGRLLPPSSSSVPSCKPILHICRALSWREEWGWRLAAVGAGGGCAWGVGPAAWEGQDAEGTESETPGGKMLINCSASLKGAKCK